MFNFIKIIPGIFVFAVFVPNTFSQLPIPAYFDIQMNMIDTIFQDESLVNLNLKIKKVNKVRSWIGDINWHVQMDNEISCELKSLKKQGNEYRYLPYRVEPTKLCDFILNDGIEEN
jgi:hypothetical protein